MGVFPVPQQGLVGRSSGKPDVLDNLQGLTLFNAYRPQLPGGNVNDGTNVTEIKDWKTGYDLIDVEVSTRPQPLSGGVINFNSKRLRVDSNLANPSDFEFMNDGSDFVVSMWIQLNSLPTGTRVLLGTNDPGVGDSTPSTGFATYDVSSNRNGFNLRNGTSYKCFGNQSNFYDLNLVQLVFAFENNGVNQVGGTMYRNGVSSYSANQTTLLVSGVPAGLLTVGGRIGNSTLLLGDFQLHDLHIFKGTSAGNDLTTIFNTPANYYS